MLATLLAPPSHIPSLHHPLQVILNYALYLTEQKAFEDAFKVRAAGWTTLCTLQEVAGRGVAHNVCRRAHLFRSMVAIYDNAAVCSNHNSPNHECRSAKEASAQLQRPFPLPSANCPTVAAPGVRARHCAV